MSFICEECGKTFPKKFNLERHTESVHNIEREVICKYCEKLLKKTNLKVHTNSCHADKKFKCMKCHKIFTSKRRRDEHKCDNQSSETSYTVTNVINEESVDTLNSSKHDTKDSLNTFPINFNDDGVPQPGPSTYRCHQCNSSFPDRQLLYNHSMRHHAQRGSGVLQSSPYQSGKEPWRDNPSFREVYETNSPLILQRNNEGTVTSTFNVPLADSFSCVEIMQSIQEIYDHQYHAFRLNLEFGLILVNIETQEYRYFRPFANQSLFERPIYISRRRDLLKLRKRLDRFDIFEYVLQQRPNTKWKPALITNVHFSLYHLNYNLGASQKLPDFIVSSKSIVSLHKRRRDAKMYDDNLCAFRCLSTHRHGHVKLELHTETYFNRWFEHTTSQSEMKVANNEFDGITIDQLPNFEKYFEMNVNVYQLHEDGIATSVYKSRCRFKDTMHLNMFQNHLSYISNLCTYASKYQCRTCERHFIRINNMYKHQRICKGRTVHEFPGGFYTAPKTIFEKLDEYGICIPNKDRLFPWFIAFDFEAMLVPTDNTSDEKHTWMAQHVPISVSICSNVNGYTKPYCIVNADIGSLVKSMIQYMTEIAESGKVLAEDKYRDAINELEQMIENPPKHLDEYQQNEISDKMQKLRQELKLYCEQMVVLGFNSSKYDMNLIKSQLAMQLNMDVDNIFTLKRNNQYACLSNSRLKFLDITSYLSPGINYVTFLKAFNVKESKGFFPYEWFDSTDKLEHTSLPSHEHFFSSLKSTNISVEEYMYCHRLWQEKSMKTFRDFLVWYNNLDVEPFVTAIQNLQQYYFQRQIDIFKVSISVPGLARHMLFETGRKAGGSFVLFDDANKDLYYTIKNNIIGGPSIIFNRFHEKGHTHIRNNPDKPCKKIIGFDANALYLYCVGLPMPTGTFTRRHIENQFKPMRKEKYMIACHWMDWLIHSRGYNIQHKLNNGREIKIGPYSVDGYDPSTNIAYQFHGCYLHGHRCWMTRFQEGKEKWEQNAPKRAKKTVEITQYLESRGYKVIEMRECTFRNEIRKVDQLKKFIDDRQPQMSKLRLSEAEILEAVVNEKLFGMVEVDIRVPDQWPSSFQHPTMSPYQYFEEMSPIFCTTDVPFDVIGDTMQDHVEKLKLSKKPRKLLVGGMRASNVLLATPLLKWYLEHGMEVTKIYQTVEFEKKNCFKQFVQDVTNARRVGDVDPSKAVIADTRKLEGNSAFGSTIMNQEKFQDTIYVKGDTPAMLEANLPQFKKLTRLDAARVFMK